VNLLARKGSAGAAAAGNMPGRHPIMIAWQNAIGFHTPFFLNRK
jgi:hypothetical protein